MSGATSPIQTQPPSDQAPALEDWIIEQAGALRSAQPDAVPAAFWDFDGTLLEGDCSEGLAREDGAGYPGLIELAIRHGFSGLYAGEDGVRQCLLDYAALIRNEGAAVAYTFAAKIFAGSPEAALVDLAREHFARVLAPWFYAGALTLWQALEAAGVRCHVISASADFFVKGAAASLGVPATRLHGLRLATDQEGRLTPDPLRPITYGPGKVERLDQVLADPERGEPPRRLRPIVALGNDLKADGPLLEQVAKLTLPAGRPTGVLVNPGAGYPADGFLHKITWPPREVARALPPLL